MHMPMPPGYGPPPTLPQGYAMPPGYPPPMAHGYAMPPPGYGYPPGYAMPPGYPGMPPEGYPPVQHPHPGYPLQVQPPPPAPVPEVIAVAQPVEVEKAALSAPLVAASAPPLAASFPAAAYPGAGAATGGKEETAGAAPPAAQLHHAPTFPGGSRDSMPVTTTAEAPGRLRQMWQKVGGGSLTLSLLIHAGILVIAGLIVVTTAMQQKAVDFLPGGGTQQGQQASSDLQHQVRLKKRNKVNQTMPKSRLVSTSMTSAITLPEAPPDMLDLPSASLMTGSGGKMGDGGFGSGGMGGGFGSGLGMGGANGFVGMTLFGKLGGEGMPGVFYDMKQTPDRKATALADLASEGDFANVINTAAGKKFSGKGLDQFFHSTQKMSFTYLLIPYMGAGEGPKAFRVEKEVQPRAWMVHYSADVRPPAPGDYRFVGLFDDALVVYVNGKPVLDGSWYPLVDYGEKRKDAEIRQDFGGPIVPGTGARRCYAGRWVKMDGLTHIDIVVGERPGGRVGGLLLVQAKKNKYLERPDGTPILPVFSITKPTPEDEARFKDYTESGFEIQPKPMAFSLTKDIFDK